MQPQRNSGVPILERSEPAAGPAANWDAIRLFLEVARCGSFRAAADALGLSINTLRRQIHELEQHMAVTLLTRHVDGVRTTLEGERILDAAKRMEAASFGIVRARDSAVPLLSGEVKLAVTEGLGTFWIAPRLVEFQRAHPGLLVNLVCAMQSADVLRLEADVAIQLTKPTAPDIKIVKLGRLHSMPFAGKPYIETYGAPKTLQEMSKHRIVVQLAEQTDTIRLFNQAFPGMPWNGFVAMITNTSTVHSWAIAKGAGIGWVPTYIHAIGGRFVPLDLDARFPFDIWLAYHADAGRIPRVRRMIEWIIDAFDPRKFPWFRDEFIHPNELGHAYKGEPLINLFEGFVHADKVEALSYNKPYASDALG
ncbi:MAG TPA: LysR family transcriptional regulator [Xanthobacteraceae bacterium]|nr:LysR family transcriptional regulator [Xanthobacteraceae bacterium]